MATRAADVGLLLAQAGADLAAYRAAGGVPDLAEPAAIWRSAAESGLSGRGGAGFSTFRKLEAVASRYGNRVLVVNGEEGEPASVKDRHLMRASPHLVIDAVRVAAHAVAAARSVLYVSDPLSARSLRSALEQWGADAPPVEVVEVAPSYVAGEETSVVSFLGGGEAKPYIKPPRPFEKGVDGEPTLVLNVETAARLALAARPGPAHAATEGVLATVQAGGRAVLVEAPATSTVGDLVGLVTTAPVAAVLLGGFAGGIWPADRVLDLPVGFEAARGIGGLWGCGSVVALGEDECPLAAVLDVAGYLRRSSAGQCGACVRSTEVMHVLLARIARGEAGEDELAQVLARAEAVRGRGNCALPDAAALVVTTFVANFPDVLEAHLAHGCRECRTHDTATEEATTRFRVAPEDCRSVVLAATAPPRLQTQPHPQAQPQAQPQEVP